MAAQHDSPVSSWRGEWHWWRTLAVVVLIALIGTPLVSLLRSPPTTVDFGLAPADRTAAMEVSPLDVSASGTVRNLVIDRDNLTVTINTGLLSKPWQARIENTTWILDPGQDTFVLPLPDKPGQVSSGLIASGFALTGALAIFAATRRSQSWRDRVESQSHMNQVMDSR